MGCGASSIKAPSAEEKTASKSRNSFTKADRNESCIESGSGAAGGNVTFGVLPTKDDSPQSSFHYPRSQANHRQAAPTKASLLKNAVISTIAAGRLGILNVKRKSMEANLHYFGEKLEEDLECDWSMTSEDYLGVALSMQGRDPVDGSSMVLFNASRAGKVEAVKAILSAAVKKGVAIPERALVSAFCAATANNRIEVVECFVQLADDIQFQVSEAVDEFKFTPAILAARHGHAQMLKVLWLAGADMNHAPNDKMTPLCIAVKEGHVACVKQLLEAGVSAAARPSDKRGPMVLAAGSGNAEIVKLLFDNGADPRETSHTGMTPLFTALEKDHGHLVELLLDLGEVTDGRNPEGQSPLMVAAAHGLVDATKVLLARKADVDFGDVDGDSPLWSAAKEGHLEVATILVEAGADVDQERVNGEAPLWIAAYNNHHDIVKMLSEAGADIDCIDQRDITPLLHAAAEGKADLARLVLDYGADVQAVDAWGNGPLVQAAARGSLEVVKMLLDCNANLKEVNQDGHDALKIAANYGHRNLAKFLADKMGVLLPKIARSQRPSSRMSNSAFDMETASPRCSSKKDNYAYNADKETRKEVQKGMRKSRLSDE